MENFIFVQWVIQKFISTALSKDSRSGLLGKVESRGSSTKTQIGDRCIMRGHLFSITSASL